MTNHTTTTGDTMPATTTTPARVTMTTDTTRGARPITLAAGVVVVIAWSGRGGVRGSAATHRTETVVGVTTTDGATGMLTLTGGAYSRGATTRALKTHRDDGRPSTQLVDAHPVGAVVAALAAVMGAARETAPATTPADDAARETAPADDGAARDDGATIVGGAMVAAPMVGAVSTGGAESWDRQDWRRHYSRAVVTARRAHARAKRAARRALKRADRRDAIRDAWSMVHDDADA
jgi:hypothetical protein